MKKIMNLVLGLTIALSAASLVGCAFGNSSDEQTAQELNDREKLMSNFSRVIGDYEGTLFADGKEIPLKVSISAVDEESGKNSKGEIRFIPVLKLRYRQLDTVRRDIIMNARYIQENGSLNAAEAKSPSTGQTSPASNDGTTLRGTFSNDRFTGVLSRNTGTLGNFELDRVSGTPTSPTNSPEEDYANRLRDLYTKVTGVYDGEILATKTENKILLRIVLVTFDVYQNGQAYPVLNARLADPVTNDPLGATFGATFQSEFIPARLLIGTGTWTAVGTLEDGVYTAKVTTQAFTNRDMVLKKK